MSPKTPVSILHEYCVLRHCVPEYIPKSEEKTSKTDTTFTFELTLFNENVSGSGTSKKAAKHETARALLKLLAEKDPDLKSFLKENGLGEDAPIETPYVHHNSENYVGKLEVLTLLNKLPNPVYNQLYEEGMSHDKIFTCSCKLGNLIKVASHRTKQQAKHTAALLMIEALEKSLKEDFVTTIPENFRVDYKLDDFNIERKKVRMQLLTSEKVPDKLKFNAVSLSKMHRVLTEPHLEVTLTIQRILDEMGMTKEKFLDLLDNNDLTTMDKIFDIVDKFKEDTGIVIDFIPIELNTQVNNAMTSEKDDRSTDISENQNCDKEFENRQTAQIQEESDEATEFSENQNCDKDIENIQTAQNQDEESGNVTESVNETLAYIKPLMLVMCRMYVVPTLTFMGVSPTIEESKRKSAILLLKHILSLDVRNRRKHNFMENFSSGDEAES